MNPYLDLKRIINDPDKPRIGKVISVKGNIITVRTAKGVIEAQSFGGNVYAPGNDVLVRGNVVEGKVSDAVPSYHV